MSIPEGQQMREEIARAAKELPRLLREFLQTHGSDLEQATAQTVRALRAGGKVLFFGNGGSASQAQHLAAELVHRFREDREGIPAIALTCDGAVVTSIANDTSFDRVFSRQVETLGRPGDVAIALSTSGNSPNVVQGLKAAGGRGMFRIGLLGHHGGKALHHTDIALTVPGDRTDRIQEIHLWAGHLICAGIEAGVSATPAESG